MKKKRVWTAKMRKDFARRMHLSKIAKMGKKVLSRPEYEEAKRAYRKKRKTRLKNPPLIQPFKVAIGATARRGHKTMMWFDGKHFRTTKVKRAMFSSIHLAKVMALSLIKRFPVLSKYTVGIYKA